MVNGILKSNVIHNRLPLLFLLLFCGVWGAHAQFLLQAPNSGDETNYRWFEASSPATVLGTNSFYEATQPGVTGEMPRQ